MVLTIAYLVLGLGLIFLAAELFTNAIEWFGKHMMLSEGAVGSVLAAVGTALPETSVAIVAIVMGGEAHTEAGIGAILGAPMMLSTLAMFITGMSVLIFAASGKRKKTIQADYMVVGRDLRSFFLVYALALAGGAIPARLGKIGIAILLLVIYAVYVYRTFHCPECVTEEARMRPLHFHRASASPHLRIVIVQLVAGVALMLIGAQQFVENVAVISKSLGISALVLSLIITPIATELPEKFNSITWMRHKKDTLALGNVTGAMVFQSSILPAIGMLFTPWHLNIQAMVSIVIAMSAAFIIWGEMTWRKRLSPYSLLIGGFMYLLYPLCVFWILPAMGY
ncbi:MAG: sodium:calcium antiporter [Armatimonadetes bacterium]|nr:sodium:calcium antiporter [Armatimonadota bacterium]